MADATQPSVRLYQPPDAGEVRLQMSEQKLTTAAEVEAAMQAVRQRVLGFRFTDVHTVEDYPIGRQLRGQCKLWVHFKAGKGCRMVRQTTDKKGVWCKPKFSTFQPGLLIVCVLPSGRAAYLGIDDYVVSLTDAAWRKEILARNPSWCEPRREPASYKIVTQELFSGKAASTEMMQHPADPPELIAAYDCFRTHARRLIDAVKSRVNLPASVVEPVASA
jgi:hypothetical protein